MDDVDDVDDANDANDVDDWRAALLAAASPMEKQALKHLGNPDAIPDDQLGVVLEAAHKYDVQLQDLVKSYVSRTKLPDCDFDMLFRLGWPRRPRNWPDYYRTSLAVQRLVLAARCTNSKSDIVRLAKPYVLDTEHGCGAMACAMDAHSVSVSLLFSRDTKLACWSSETFFEATERGVVSGGWFDNMNQTTVLYRLGCDCKVANDVSKSTLCMYSLTSITVIRCSDLVNCMVNNAAVVVTKIVVDINDQIDRFGCNMRPEFVTFYDHHTFRPTHKFFVFDVLLAKKVATFNTRECSLNTAYNASKQALCICTRCYATSSNNTWLFQPGKQTVHQFPGNYYRVCEHADGFVLRDYDDQPLTLHVDQL